MRIFSVRKNSSAYWKSENVMKICEFNMNKIEYETGQKLQAFLLTHNKSHIYLVAVAKIVWTIGRNKNEY